MHKNEFGHNSNSVCIKKATCGENGSSYHQDPHLTLTYLPMCMCSAGWCMPAHMLAMSRNCLLLYKELHLVVERPGGRGGLAVTGTKLGVRPFTLQTFGFVYFSFTRSRVTFPGAEIPLRQDTQKLGSLNICS